MNLLVQFQCMVYSFLYGFIMSGMYHILNRILWKIPYVLRYLFQIIIGCSFGFLYYAGLVYLNDGILRIYFFVMIFVGYLFYQKYYAYYLLYYLEFAVKIIKRIISPFIFFFHYINAIIQKKVKKVKLKWRNKNKRDIKNS